MKSVENELHGADDVGEAAREVHAPGPLKLNYGHGAADGGPERRGPGAVVFLLVAVLGAVVPFVSFAFRVSPLDVMREFFDEVWQARSLRGMEWQLVYLGVTFFAAGPILFWKIRLLVPARTGRGARAAMWALAGVASVPPALFAMHLLGEIWAEQRMDIDMWPVPAGVALLLLWWSLAIVLAVRGRGERAVTAGLYAGYLANATYCLGGFYGSRSPGYWITCVVAAGMVVESALLMARRRAPGST